MLSSFPYLFRLGSSQSAFIVIFLRRLTQACTNLVREISPHKKLIIQVNWFQANMSQFINIHIFHLCVTANIFSILHVKFHTWTNEYTIDFQIQLNCPTQALAPSKQGWVSIIFTWRLSVRLSVRLYVCLSHSLAKPPSNLESWNLAQVSALRGRWRSH